MIKVDFGDQDVLQKVIEDKITILNQRYLVVEFLRKSRAIKCNKCQDWGHIHRYCKNNPKCGKCSGNHETNTCEVLTLNAAIVRVHIVQGHRNVGL